MNDFQSRVSAGTRLLRHSAPHSKDDLAILPAEYGPAPTGAVQRLQHYYEAEQVIPCQGRTAVDLDYTPLLHTQHLARPGLFYDPEWARASMTAFERMWNTLAAPLPQMQYEPAEEYLPADWAWYLPYPTLNPAQVEAMPTITSDDNAVIVAPTGAGKTVIGMAAALREIRGRHRKAAWLVPQRSLTNELDADLDTWRQHGIRVQRLSGEATVDAQRVRDADIWVTTTEKFESLCRSATLHEAVSEVGTLVVDEIHLLGDSSRGPLLETILTRLRNSGTDVRVVGLSATVSNAAEIADWLNATLTPITWRPTRLTQQVLTVPAGIDRDDEARYRKAATTALTKHITSAHGSVLVFCGTKVAVRDTALALAASRGVDTDAIDRDDIDDIARICHENRIGLHYADWPYRAESERRFRDREADVLVATSTLAAGVNTPARAVIVRDTRIGTMHMDISAIQQMFGRAGRAGQEPEGWAYLITTPDETGPWRTQIAHGYTVSSHIEERPHDHLLAEIVQGRIQTDTDAEHWWSSTLACHQGQPSSRAVHDAMHDLNTWGHIDRTPTSHGDHDLAPTALGRLTSRMLIGAHDAVGVHARLRAAKPPRSAKAAEDTLIDALVKGVNDLASQPSPPPTQQPALARLIAARGDLTANTPQAEHRATNRGDLAKAALLLAARSPHTLAQGEHHIAGISRQLLTPALNTAARYLAWMAAQGTIGSAPAWAPITAFDLDKRVSWPELGIERGGGRLVWLAQRIAGHDHAAVARLWRQWRAAGVRSPDSATLPPLVDNATLRQRAQLTVRAPKTAQAPVTADVTTNSAASVFAATPSESGTVWRRVSLRQGRGTASIRTPATIATFTPGGDCRGSGWLSAFSSIKDG